MALPMYLITFSDTEGAYGASGAGAGGQPSYQMGPLLL